MIPHLQCVCERESEKERKRWKSELEIVKRSYVINALMVFNSYQEPLIVNAGAFLRDTSAIDPQKAVQTLSKYE